MTLSELIILIEFFSACDIILIWFLWLFAGKVNVLKVFYVKIEYKDGKKVEDIFLTNAKAKEMCDLLLGEDKEGAIKLVETKCREVDL
ncbi:hypothetical protein B0S91_0102 [Caldicellulosiruptor bescii]|nr:hypothetical protein B0S91_0102 [Caldicellulosiruptor bescii]PFH24267.1 hypothetical protein B0S92_0645 [Caldicellulosiruptor bescii]